MQMFFARCACSVPTKVLLAALGVPAKVLLAALGVPAKVRSLRLPQDDAVGESKRGEPRKRS